MSFTGCSVICDIANLVTALLDAIPSSSRSLLTPLIDPLIQNFLPNPLGIEGHDGRRRAARGRVARHGGAAWRARIVPGGYVNLAATA